MLRRLLNQLIHSLTEYDPLVIDEDGCRRTTLIALIEGFLDRSAHICGKYR